MREERGEGEGKVELGTEEEEEEKLCSDVCYSLVSLIWCVDFFLHR